MPLTHAERQELQLRIARSRRRLERDVVRFVDQSLLLGAWSNYVREHPGRSMLAATGIGVALSGLISRIPVSGKFLERFADLAMGAGWSRVLSEVHAALERHKRKDRGEPANES
jgi:hypothetical protein